MVSEYYRRPIQPFLRDPPKNQARSAYAVEVNPWTTRGDVEAALLFRGTIISAHGEIDYRLSALCIKCSKITEYAGVREQYPFSFPARIKFLRTIFQFGSLQRFEQLAMTVFQKIEGDFQFRNLVAHAHMQVLPENWVTFQDFPMSRGQEVTKRHEPMPLKELERRAWKAALRSRACQYLDSSLDQMGILPPLE
jgi:hypothetical protein